MFDSPSSPAAPAPAGAQPYRPQPEVIDGVFVAIALIALANATAIFVALRPFFAELAIYGFFAGAVSGRLTARALSDARRDKRIWGRAMSFLLAPALNGVAMLAPAVIMQPSLQGLVLVVPLGLFIGEFVMAVGAVGAPLSLAPWILAWSVIEWLRLRRARRAGNGEIVRAAMPARTETSEDDR